MAILVALAAVCATLIGGLVAIRMYDRQHLVLGLAAGLMLGVVAFELVPEALEQAGRPVFGVPMALLMAAAGFLSLHVVERSLELHRGGEEDPHHLPSLGLAAGIALVVHSVFDGVGIGAGFQAGTTTGITIAVAVVGHDFADGFNTFTVTALHGNARRRAMTLLALDALAPMVGAVLGTVIPFSPTVVGLYLGYFAGFLLYLATNTILPEAHATRPSWMSLLFTVAGAALIWPIVGVSH